METIACGTPITSVHNGPEVWNVNTCGYSTPGLEKVYSFTPSVTGNYSLNVTAATGGFIDYFWKSASLGCSASGWMCIDDIFAPGTFSIGWLTAGVQYYFLLDPESTGAFSHTFSIGCTPAPCGVPTAITTNATSSSSANATWACGGCSGYYFWEYGPVGYAPGIGGNPGIGAQCCGSFGITSTTNASITGILSNNTVYDFYVRQNCSGTYSDNSTVKKMALFDQCAGAPDIACGGSATGPTAGMSAEAGLLAACNAGGYTAGSVWYHFAGTGDLVTASTCNATGYDTRITVFAGSCGSLTCVAGNDDDASCASSTVRSTVTFLSAAGVDYYIMVHGNNANTGILYYHYHALRPARHPPMTTAPTQFHSRQMLTEAAPHQPEIIHATMPR